MARTLTQRMASLRYLVELTEDRVDPELTQRARRVLGKVDERLEAGEQTVVALAGPTGAGKSTLVNALAGADVATPGVRRPTTSETLAVSFGPTNTRLLDWLEVRRRHEVQLGGLDGLILLDLPDHDSVRVSHRDEVERLIKVVDQFVWVTDPQKYADASIHERYLQPLAKHAGVITVVLNQIDRLRSEELRQVTEHLRSLLADDGLRGVAVLPVSAATSEGLTGLRAHLGEIAAKKNAAVARLTADLTVLADDFDAATEGSGEAGLTKEAVARLEAGMAQAAGVPLVERAVQQAMVHRGALATGWPLVSWWRHFRPDPLKRLRLGGGKPTEQIEAASPRSSLPERGPVVGAQLATSLRAAASDGSAGLPEGWRGRARAAVQSSAELLPDTLDRAVVETDLGTEQTPVWWSLLRFLQWLLIAAVVVGVGWLSINMVLLYLGLPALPGVPVGTEEGFQVPLPTALLGGGLILGFVLSLGARLFVGLGAAAAPRRAGRRLRRRIRQIAQDEVVQPLTDEINRYEQARKLIRKL